MQKNRNPRKDWFRRIGHVFGAFSDIPFSLYCKNKLSPILKGKSVVPNPQNVYRALELVPFDRVKVVILGQDPYYQTSGRETYATGLAFALNPKILQNTSLHKLKGGKSLRTILAAVGRELKIPVPGNPETSLEAWAKEGVLLLNSALTTRRHCPGSHLSVWKGFVAAIILALNSKKRGVLFVLTCKSAKSFLPLISPKHSVLFNYKHPSRCWRISTGINSQKADVSFFKLTSRQFAINWGSVLRGPNAN